MKEFDSPYFVYTGNAYPHKNLERAIKAIVLLNQTSNIRIMFFIVSSRNIFTSRLERFIKKNDATAFVKLLGFLDDKKLDYLYANSIGFVFPSFTEGFGLPGLEAMKAGTILLASDIPVFREIYGHHAVYFNPYDIQSIESSMRKVLSLTKVEGNKMIREGKQFVKKYSWEKMTKETLDVYESVKL